MREEGEQKLGVEEADRKGVKGVDGRLHLFSNWATCSARAPCGLRDFRTRRDELVWLGVVRSRIGGGGGGSECSFESVRLGCIPRATSQRLHQPAPLITDLYGQLVERLIAIVSFSFWFHFFNLLTPFDISRPTWGKSSLCPGPRLALDRHKQLCVSLWMSKTRFVYVTFPVRR